MKVWNRCHRSIEELYQRLASRKGHLHRWRRSDHGGRELSELYSKMIRHTRICNGSSQMTRALPWLTTRKRFDESRKLKEDAGQR
jgi:hypothetical protein